ncbi:S26 family signal peptidase [Vibrio lentus]|nr:S26 family signal peptidase [Vibrio lentus]
MQTFVVPQGHYFALGTLPTSFDSRYWGLVEHSQIIGVGYAFL